MSAAYLETATLSKPGKLLAAAKHNLREIQAELGADSHIDATKCHLNVRLAGPATGKGVADFAGQIRIDAGIFKVRKNAVRAVEVLITLPPHSTTIDSASFFTDSLEWIRDFFLAPVLSAVVHHDEEAPHMHVLLLPLVNGRMVGTALLGDRVRMQAIQAGFYDTVARRYGLSRPQSAKRMNKSLRVKAATRIFEELQPFLVGMQPNIRKALLDTITGHPEPLLEACGITLQENQPQTPIGDLSESQINETPIGNCSTPEKVESKSANSYLCVGVCSKSPPKTSRSSQVASGARV